MHDEAWLNSFTERASTPVSTIAKPKSELPNRSLKSNGSAVPSSNGAPKRSVVLPKAEVKTRAKSLSPKGRPRRTTASSVERSGVDDFNLHEPTDEIATDVQYVDWYHGLQDDLLEASHEEYKLYFEQLRLAESHLDKILDSANLALEQLKSLSDSFTHVDAETSAFQAQCEAILGDQNHTTKLASDIAENLQYYTYLEPITKRLNAPGASNLVRRQEFSDVLSNLDACIEYMQAHPKQKDAASYRARYRQLLTRGLTLIRNQFTTSLKDLAADVAKELAAKQLSDTTANAFLYAKFRVNAPELKRMGFEVQRRSVAPDGSGSTTEGEYAGLLNELHQSYASVRLRLLYPLVSKSIATIAATPSTTDDLVAFARSCIVYIRSLCADEYDLWGAWFVSEGALYEYLESLCEPMYDQLRPRTIRETQLVKLCELCTLIQTQYLATPDESIDEMDSQTDVKNKLDFARLVQPALEDAQTRLVFLALTTLRNDIEVYKPQPADLDYPAKNHRVQSKQPVLSGKKTNGVKENGQLSLMTGGTSSDWYPTLRKAIWLLGSIYRLVNSAVFDDLAHQIVHQTTLSLQQASLLIAKRTSPTDSHLFLLKHLLLLKQQIIAFDIEFVATPEISFTSSLTSTFGELSDRGSLFNPLNWGRMVANGGYGLLVPRVVTNMLDAKSELDGSLRTVINEFTASFVTRITEGISESTITKAGPAFNPLAASVKVRTLIEEQTPFLRKKLDEYLDDLRTRETLVAAIQDQVSLVYEEFFDGFIKAGGSASGGGKKGKGREDGVWDPDVFAEWSRDCFGVSRLGFDDEGEGDDDRRSVRDEGSE